MPQEIERKFLVSDNSWKEQASKPKILRQAYLNTDPERTVRIRIDDNNAWLTIKSKNIGISRQEFEYAIPTEEAEQLFKLCETPPLEKYRYCIQIDQHCWEIDEFLGSNAGLVVAEIELRSENENFYRPSWLAKEVSHDSRYFNSQLIVNPVNTWQS